MSYDLPIIKEKTERAVRILLKNDLFLLQNNADEITISHKLAEYLQQEFLDWHVDCEYNRNRDEIKEIGDARVRPDIIVHIRNIKNNLLIVEIKKSNTTDDINSDKERLKNFTLSGEYKYQFGLFILFYVGDEFEVAPDIEYYKDGQNLE